MTSHQSNLLNLKLQNSVAGREADLTARLQKITTDVSDVHKALALFRVMATEYLRGIGAAHLSKSTGGLWSAASSDISGQITTDDLNSQRIQAICPQAVSQNRQLRLNADSNSKFDFLLVPINAFGGERLILLVKLRPQSGDGNIAPLTSMLQMIASAHELWFARSESLKQTELLQASAAVIELVSMVGKCDSVQHACQTITQETKRFLNCLQVSIGIFRGARFETAANSESSTFDSNSELFSFYEHAWQEASLKPELSVWPPGGNETRHGLIQHRKLVERLRLGASISVPLKNEENETIGVLTAVGNCQELSRELSMNFLRCAGQRMGSTIELLGRAQEGALRRIATSLRKRADKQKMAIITATITILCAIMLVPLPYRVRCLCESDAVSRRYAAAPFDGVIKQGYVRAGDIVQPGELLAEMNGRDIRQELARAVFETHRAEKKRDLFLAQGNVAESLLAGMEAQSLTVSRDLLVIKEENLNIVSPVRGVILDGDLDEAQDMPVQVGQTLFEIGPLDPMKIQLSIPADEIANVRTGMEVRIWLSGLGSKSLSGRIINVLPDAEIRDNENVFVAEVAVENRDNLLRPGMRGTATVTCDAHSLAWNLFHKPWEYAASRLSW